MGKDSDLFLQLLRRLADDSVMRAGCTWSSKTTGIHSSRLIQWALTEEFHGRIVLHLLPRARRIATAYSDSGANCMPRDPQSSVRDLCPNS
jgi:hypothetical protein